MKQYKPVILPIEYYDEIDNRRGQVPRSTYLQGILDEVFNRGDRA